MGCCCSYSIISNNNIKPNVVFVLKFPNGTHYIEYDNINKKFIKYDDINEWIQKIYKSKNWTNWIIYNDQQEKNTFGKGGHSKGILAWNNSKISWLCHSVPKFPDIFENNNENITISEIEKGELIYGQSFQYIEIPYDEKILINIIIQLNLMCVHCYNVNINSYYDSILNNQNKNENIREMVITDKIIHIAKSPKYNIDIYNDYIEKNYYEKWFIETWNHSNKVILNSKKIIHIKLLKFDNVNYRVQQDHSKWGVSKKKIIFY